MVRSTRSWCVRPVQTHHEVPKRTTSLTTSRTPCFPHVERIRGAAVDRGRTVVVPAVGTVVVAPVVVPELGSGADVVTTDRAVVGAADVADLTVGFVVAVAARAVVVVANDQSEQGTNHSGANSVHATVSTDVRSPNPNAIGKNSELFVFAQPGVRSAGSSQQGPPPSSGSSGPRTLV